MVKFNYTFFVWKYGTAIRKKVDFWIVFEFQKGCGRQ